LEIAARPPLITCCRPRVELDAGHVGASKANSCGASFELIGRPAATLLQALLRVFTARELVILEN
jgi:hypothetical protein